MNRRTRREKSYARPNLYLNMQLVQPGYRLVSLRQIGFLLGLVKSRERLCYPAPDYVDPVTQEPS